MRDLEAWWSEPAFAAEVTDWARTQLRGRGITVVGPAVAHRVRFWSAVLRVPTDHGDVWVKAASPGQGFEVELTTALARIVPTHVLAPIATLVDADGGRFWMLSPDGGTTLREHGGATEAHWRRLVIDAASMQRALIPHRAALAATGLSALSARDGVAYTERMIGWGRGLPSTDPQHLSHEQAQSLTSLLPTLASDLGVLIDSGVPDTLQHNDLSDANAFVSGADGLGPLRFFDLGDAFWSHPFAALHLTLCFATASFPWPDLRAAVAGPVIEAYLSCWPEHGTVAELWPLVVPALRLAQLHRVESWRRLLAAVPPRPESTRLPDVLALALATHPAPVPPSR